MRYIITAARAGLPYTQYISKSGNVTANAARAAVFSSPEDAELPYWRTAQPRYRLTLEQLPPRQKLENAVLQSTPVE